MELLGLFVLITWIAILIAILMTLFIRVLLPKYSIIASDVSFQELLIALNAAIQTEFELWDKDVFTDKKAITNSNFENYYYEITSHIINSLSPTFFLNISKYLTEDAIVSIIGRKTKEYLSSKISGSI